MIPLDRLVREPSDLAVAASFRRLNEAIHSRDQARIDLVLAEISGLAAREARAEGSARETPGPRLHQPSLAEGRAMKEPSIQPTNSSTPTAEASTAPLRGRRKKGAVP